MMNATTQEQQMNKMTKAELVRAMIFGAKAQGHTADALIASVMEQMGFARQLARTYINNNWDKVTAPIVVTVETVVETAVEAVPAQQNKTLSMSKDAIRKREARARAAAAKAAQVVA
jgi:hypothetical protein